MIVPPREVADFNADGKLDVAGLFGDNGLTVQLGNGDGSYGPPITTAVGSVATSLVLADFNADGRPDAAVTDLYRLGLGTAQRRLLVARRPAVGEHSRRHGHRGQHRHGQRHLHGDPLDASDVDVTVHYVTADITAAAGSDYTAASGTVIIPAGQTSGTFTVAVMGDRLAEPTETFAVNLSAATNATIGDGQGDRHHRRRRAAHQHQRREQERRARRARRPCSPSRSRSRPPTTSR